MTFKVGQTVRVKRDIHRVSSNLILDGMIVDENYWQHKLYAQEGETGTVTEVFRGPPGGPPVVYAKVNIDDQIKTFRLSSLEQIKP
jgi:hypothetical protein